ncbi:DUF4126 domain-containing protein [Kiloniella sp. b19]|uniref:DUF4126 domain-containing protein n=1 Tax=Kiloniella sp. GXU_MW_B19 TaxID=3141326 RepID=UPI0031D4DB00
MPSVELIILALGLAWASGINVYAALALLGVLNVTGYYDLPPGLDGLGSPVILFFAVLLYIVEFVADKIPVVDSIWDALHSFIRIPAGAFLAAAALSGAGVEAQVIAFLLGGGLAAVTHTLKTGTRAVVNTSPEPFTNFGLSIFEDGLVIGGVLLAIVSPLAFAMAFALFLVFAIWMLPRIFRAVGSIFSFLTGGRKTVRRNQADATDASFEEDLMLASEKPALEKGKD